MSPKAVEKAKLLGALVALGLAGIGFVRFYKNSNPAAGKAYFYDLSGQKLFVAPHSSVPPIKGVVGDEEDAVRAIVISTSGNCDDPGSRRIAYLETFTPELKRQVEARTSGAQEEPAPNNEPTPSIGRSEAQGYILVKRPEESDWHPMTTPEAQEILRTINAPGPDGKVPVVCVP